MTKRPEHQVEFLPSKDFDQFRKEGTDAYRIFVMGRAWGERWGEDVLISYFQEESLGYAIQQLDIWTDQVSWKPRAVFARRLVKQPVKNDAALLVRGSESALRQVIQENGLKYQVEISSGYSIGFFSDQRSNRKYILRRKPKKMLNCFAYTCAFSVAAASVGAQTVSIDLAAKALDLGRRNFGLNKISLEGHRFLVDDVFCVLERLSRRGEKYDCIILDPPTFSRSFKGTFRAKQDFPNLIRSALHCAASGACLLLSTNCSSICVTDLRNVASSAASLLNISARFYESEPQCDVLEGRAPSTIWMELN